MEVLTIILYLWIVARNILKAQIHGVGGAAKTDADFGALFAAVYFDDAAFYAFEGAFYYYDAVVLVKADQGLADFWAQAQKVLDNFQVAVVQGDDVGVAVEKMIEIRQFFEGVDGSGVYFVYGLYYYIGRKHWLQFPHPLALPPDGKLAGEVNKIMLLCQLRRKLFQIINKNLLPPRSHLNNIVLHHPPL